MDYALLEQAVATGAALRRRQRLQPVGGPGDKIFPPTYPGEGRNAPPRHVLETRRVAGHDVHCALVDSVQSQANRLEEALLAAIRARAIEIPYLVVDFSGHDLAGLTEITSLDAPHRVYDAILRDSSLDGTPFPASALGQSLAKAKLIDSSALLEASPTALVFGAWNSTGEGGGLGAKFPRVLVSEIAAFGVSVEDAGADPKTGEMQIRTGSRRTGSRIDPVSVLKNVKVYQGENRTWDIDPAKVGKKSKQVRPSEINHGNIAPSTQELGVTCDYAEQVMVISFAGLRRLGFGSPERDAAGRAYLAALGLVAVAEQDARGYALRSRCDLVCEGRAPLQVIRNDGAVDEVTVGRNAAHALYRDAVAAARSAGFSLSMAPVRLTPQAKLVHIVAESQRLALAGRGGEADDAAEG